MSEKPQTFLITVNVIEGRHYIWENMDSAVIVKIGDKSHCTAVKRKTECPFYNEYFVFEITCTQEQLMDKSILVTVIQPKSWCRKRKILGNIKLDVATVHAQPNCQFYHKWAVLASPKYDIVSGPTGYLKLDICLLSRGQIPKLPTNVTNDDIESNLLTPMGFISERQKAQFIFDIYNCKNLKNKKDVFEDELLTSYRKNVASLSTRVEITFSGYSATTTVRRLSHSPEFNERLIITDLFPPLCQRVKVEICHDSNKKSVHSFCHLNLKSISSDTLEGFLPTFGPSYVHMYFRKNFEDYAGELLMSMKTQLLNTDATASVGQKLNMVHGIAPLHEEDLFEFQDTFLFASIFEATNISKRLADKPISFRLTFGHVSSTSEEDNDKTQSGGDANFLANSTLPQKPIKVGKHFCYLDFTDKKPCLRITSKWPDFRKRMYNSNMLAKIANDLNHALIDLEELFKKNKFTYSEKIDLALKEALDYIAASCKKYCDILTNTYNFDYGTDLDTERVKICLKTMIFQCKAYIFEGEIQPGFDITGFVDAFLQISIGNQVKETETKKKAMSPVWDQTLIFHNILICGSKEDIGDNLPAIVVEMYDLDKCYRKDFIGRLVVSPEVKFLNDIGTDKQINMNWYGLQKGDEVFAKILAAFELVEIESITPEPLIEIVTPVPTEIKPIMKSYRIEILFWGMRHLKKFNMIKINRPRISFYCSNKCVHSETIENAKKFPNFNHNTNVHSLNVMLSTQMDYVDSFQLKLYHSRKFGVHVYAGISQNDALSFIFNPMTIEERNSKLNNVESTSVGNFSTMYSSKESVDSYQKVLIPIEEPKPPTQRYFGFMTKLWKYCQKSKEKIEERKLTKLKRKGDSIYSLLSTSDDESYEEDFDWWTKFYASIEETTIENRSYASLHVKNKLKVYKTELENQPEFKGFSDILYSFGMMRSFRTGDEALDEQHTTGVFKGSIGTLLTAFLNNRLLRGIFSAVKIYRWPPDDDKDEYVTPKGIPIKEGVFAGYPSNTITNYVLRVYCVRGLSLRPKDHNGKSDPYLKLTLGEKVADDRKNFIANNVNPIFGRLFEFQASFPHDHTLLIACYDFDRGNKDDLIGETKIDLENRFYTKHRAYCGIADSYFKNGYCAWRDQKAPTEILSKICTRWNLDGPIYTQNSVKIGAKEFVTTNFFPTSDPEHDKETLALTALKRWQEMPLVGFKLVPEHVETRSLFHPDKPGIEQGKLQLWIDIFARQESFPPPKIDITPRKAIPYELRVIIWNTEEVKLDEDELITGEKKSDIYVQGFLDSPDNAQYTDVHYRSLTGEGNFNWRFIFHFDYLPSESKMVIKKKDCTFSFNVTEEKMPVMLNLTVWDNDTFSRDDFLEVYKINYDRIIKDHPVPEPRRTNLIIADLNNNGTLRNFFPAGSLVLDLSRMPRSAKSSKKCNLSIIQPNSRKINLFKLKRTRGWWPFKAINKKTRQETLAGKLEAEFEVLPKEEADKIPVGLGRQGPHQLPEPRKADVISKGIKPCSMNYFAHYKCSKCGRRKNICKCILVILLLKLVFVSILLALYFTGYIDNFFDNQNCKK